VQKDIKQVIDTLLKEMLDPKNFTFLSFYVVVYGVGTSLLIDFIFAAPNLKVFVPIINTIFTLIGFAIPVLFLLRKPRKKTKKSNSVKEKSKSILNIKPPIFLSESMAVLYKNTKDVGEKIVSLRMKIRKTEEYIAMLDEHKQDSLAADMAQRQK
jgi:hypothetical protein